MIKMDVKVYSTPTCPYCIKLKSFLKENNIDFEDINVAGDHEKAKEMVKLSGQMGVPVTAVDDKLVIGYNLDELKNLLGLGDQK